MAKSDNQVQSCSAQQQLKTSIKSEILRNFWEHLYVAQCLSHLHDAPKTVREHYLSLINRTLEILLYFSASSNQSTKHICRVACTTYWWKIWDHALDGGSRETKLMQTLFKVMSTWSCVLCGEHINSFFFWTTSTLSPIHTCKCWFGVVCRLSKWTDVSLFLYSASRVTHFCSY